MLKYGGPRLPMFDTQPATHSCEAQLLIWFGSLARSFAQFPGCHSNVWWFFFLENTRHVATLLVWNPGNSLLAREDPLQSPNFESFWHLKNLENFVHFCLQRRPSWDLGLKKPLFLATGFNKQKGGGKKKKNALDPQTMITVTKLNTNIAYMFGGVSCNMLPHQPPRLAPPAFRMVFALLISNSVVIAMAWKNNRGVDDDKKVLAIIIRHHPSINIVINIIINIITIIIQMYRPWLTL